MFDSEGASELFATIDDVEYGDCVEDVIARSKLPEAARLAPLTYCQNRIIDAAEIDKLCSERLNPGHCPDMADRLAARRTALTKLLGREVTCAMVRLPGCSYTMEVDIALARVVHWEYQQI